MSTMYSRSSASIAIARGFWNRPAELPLLECHLLDFAGDLYGEAVRVRFVERLRGEARFADLVRRVAEAKLAADGV